MTATKVTAAFRVEGGTADDGRLDIYDAAETFEGLARAFNIVAHAFANDDAIRKRADRAQGARTYIHSSAKGCFEEKIDIEFDYKTALKIGPSVLRANFWDYLSLAWSAATGQEFEPTTSRVTRLVEENPDFVFEMADVLETPMQKLHKTISKDHSMFMCLERPKIGDILTFDYSTLEYVTVRNEDSERTSVVGNVTKFNVLSDFGRFFSKADGRVISFRLAHPEDKDMRSLVIKSMSDVVDGNDGFMVFDVSPVLSAQGVIKRYIVHGITEAR